MTGISKQSVDSLATKLETLELTDDELSVLDALLTAESDREVEGFWDPGEYSPSSNFGLPDLRGRILKIAGTPKGVVINHEEQYSFTKRTQG